jgi:hypothetical protein
LDHTLDVLSTDAQSSFQLGYRWREDENACHIPARPFSQLLRALPVDVEQNVPPTLERRLDRRPRRPIAMAEYLRPFQELAHFDHGLEARCVDEMIVAAIDLARSLLACRHRDRQRDAGIGFQQPA